MAVVVAAAAGGRVCGGGGRDVRPAAGLEAPARGCGRVFVKVATQHGQRRIVAARLLAEAGAGVAVAAHGAGRRSGAQRRARALSPPLKRSMLGLCYLAEAGEHLRASSIELPSGVSLSGTDERELSP